MATNKLVAYWIRLRQRGTDGQFWDLSDLRGHESGIYYETIEDMFSDFCRGHREFTYVDNKNEETFKIDHYERSGNIIEGELHRGESGLLANHYNTEEHKRIVGARGTEISEEIPFYFLFHRLRNNSDRALLILREYGHQGVKRIVTDRFKKAIRTTTKQGIYQESRVITEDGRRALEQADSIASLKLIGEGRLRAIDHVGQNAGVNNTDSLPIDKELQITAGEGTLRSIARRILGNPAIKYAGIDMADYNKAKVTVKQGGSDLTFSLLNPRVKMRMVLTADDVDFAGQHPTPDTVSIKAREFANHVLDEYDDGTIPTETLLNGRRGTPVEPVEEE